MDHASHHHNNKEYPAADRHKGHSPEIFLRKFWVSLILTVPVLAYSDVWRKIFNWQAPVFIGSGYLSLIFGSVIFFYGGWVFIVGAWRELKAKLPGMMTLIAMAISVAYLYSTWAVFANKEETLFWELATLITIMLFGHYLEMKAIGSARGALKELSKLLPDTAAVILGNEIKIIPLNELEKGDMVLVRPGAGIPADGIVAEGRSDANEAMVTGESKPVSKGVGSEVIAGTINGAGALKIKVMKVGEQTFLAGVTRLVVEAQSSKSRLQALADKAAFYLTVIAAVAGFLTFFAWLAAGAGFEFAIERLVAVLVIACPHALGLAVPLVASISTTMAAKSGFLVRQRLALEMARNIGVILFDKTGTLTKGEYGITNLWPVNVGSDKELLRLAASVDSRSEHFISRAIVQKAKEDNIQLSEVSEFSGLPGRGAKGSVDGREIFIGGLAIFDEFKPAISEALKKEIDEENKKGKTIVYVISKNELLGVFALADLIREESRQAVNELKNMGVKVAMITGDSENVAQWVSRELGIDEYFAKVLPEEKAEKVKMIQSRGEKVAMVGDGINDAPALAAADLGIAIGAGTNVAIESAGIILVKNDPRDIVKIIKLSEFTYAKMAQNLFWAAGYNVVALPLAAGALAFKGIMLQPALSALLMSLSTVAVAVNALFLKLKKLA